MTSKKERKKLCTLKSLEIQKIGAKSFLVKTGEAIAASYIVPFTFIPPLICQSITALQKSSEL